MRDYFLRKTFSCGLLLRFTLFQIKLRPAEHESSTSQVMPLYKRDHQTRREINRFAKTVLIIIRQN